MPELSPNIQPRRFAFSTDSFVMRSALTPLREAALFGMFGAGTNITDGRFKYFRYPPDMSKQQLFEYTIMPMHQKSFFPLDILRGAELVNDFRFTQGVPVLKVPGRRNADGQSVGHIGQGGGYEDTTTVLYGLESDPGQLAPMANPSEEKRLLGLMRELMLKNEAPPEAFERLGLARA